MHTHSIFGHSQTGRPFMKMHGLQNHFIIVDARTEAFSPSAEEVVRLCDPRTGIGSDQLVIIEPSATVDAFMRLINIDGREVEACGNATRCVGWLLLEESGADRVVLETLAGTISCQRAGDGDVSCEMGKVVMDWQKIPLSREMDTGHLDYSAGPLRDGIALNIGNPHVVFFVPDIDAIDIAAIAPGIQQDPLFPEQVNVGVVDLAAPDHLRSKVYERGAGLTTACGSGACVAAFAALVRGLTDQRRIRVSMSAGDVIIDISDDGIATMTGPVAHCFSGFL